MLLGVGGWAVITGRVRQRRELLYVALPAVVYMAFAMEGGMNIGIRHVLPVYVFLAAFIGGTAWALIQRNRRWLPVVAVLLVLQAASVLHTFPAYIAYANEAWGGPANAHKYLSDSSSDWGQQLKAVKRYLDDRGIRDCWFAYFAEGPVDSSYYRLPCRMLAGAGAGRGMSTALPSTLDGTVLLSAGPLSGFEFGPPPLQPYASFKSLTPVDVIDYGVMVYRGHFEVPLLSALSHVQQVNVRLRAKDVTGALAEARAAEALAPTSARVLAAVGQALEASGDANAAADYYRQALAIANTTPGFQVPVIADLQRRLGGK